MQLFCSECKENHEFTAWEVERIVYTLHAELCEALCGRDGAPEYYKSFEGKDVWDVEFCPKNILANSWEPEAYREFCDGWVDVRRNRQGVVVCDGCSHEDAPDKLIRKDGYFHCEKCGKESG